jgi:hypothetical protein
VSAYATALGLTLLIEAPIYVFGLSYGAARRWGSALVTGLVVNLISHPLAFLAIYPVLEGPVGAVAALAVTELAVVFGEAAMLWHRGIVPAVALATSASANVASLVLGVAITR